MTRFFTFFSVVAIIIPLTTASCVPSDYEAVKQDNSRLGAELKDLRIKAEADARRYEDEMGHAHSQLVTCHADLTAAEHDKTAACDKLEEAAKEQLQLKGFEVARGDRYSVPTPCDPGVTVTVTKVESDRAYLGYQVAGEQRYSDPLYFTGKFADRSALFITTGLDYPLLLTVRGCQPQGASATCELACLQVRSEHLSCFHKG